MNYKFAPYVKNLESEIERLMLQSLSPEDVFDWSTGIVIPVPLHKSKLKQRGFNQSEAIAHVLAKIVGGEVSASLLVRTRASGVQSSIKDDRLRVQNVRGVFSVNKALIARYSSAKVFVLVDDVYTSGSTLQECARVIKRSFPQSSVVGFTLARG
ncbi:ComF family protein [candidate division WWE3 bacterium]|uniref:ComF family protein n=1 Tax=candidate division WWE3 bacterium TaxID=2053526 RepID=A0A955LKP9_UNCKA|nr:ComF family protein [candidate division WWE3 bacterium]